MWTTGNRIKILVGHYGSGKTEIALNMALSIRKANLETALIDLDIVNPFFRSAERGDLMGRSGIELIAPQFALTGVDVPSLPAEIQSVFERAALRVVFDVGGDDAGAVALGQYSAQFARSGYDLIYVVNVFRPRSATAEEIIQMIDRVSLRSRLQPTALINNANLADETDASHLEEGMRVLDQVSRARQIPILASCGTGRALSGFVTDLPTFEIERRMKPEWMEI